MPTIILKSEFIFNIFHNLKNLLLSYILLKNRKIKDMECIFPRFLTRHTSSQWGSEGKKVKIAPNTSKR